MGSKKSNILIISHDKIGPSMAGPGIRYHHMAEFLSSDFNITVGFFDPSYLPPKAFTRKYQVRSIDSNDFKSDFKDFDTIIAMYLTDVMLDYCVKSSVFLVFDLYAPVPVENLALKLFSGEQIEPHDIFAFNQTNSIYSRFFEYGDLFLVSNRRQKDFWLGNIFGAGLINLQSYPKRPIYDRVIEAPMGIESSLRLKHTKNVLRNSLPGITRKDKILLWTGGIWNWFDAQSLIRAMAILEKNHPEIKLVFFGITHPNPDVPTMREAYDARITAKEHGLLDKTVYMLDGWVKYEDRINYLLEADVAINTTHDTLENEFSHRTRVLDHFLTNLPTISTSGDYLSDDVIQPLQLGLTVPAGSPEDIAKAILDILTPQTHTKIKHNIATHLDKFDWKTTLAELRIRLLNDEPMLDRTVLEKKYRKKQKIVLLKRIIPIPIKKLLLKVVRYGK